MSARVIRVLLNGCGGRMGRMFTGVAARHPDIEIVAGMDVVPLAAGSAQVLPSYPVFIRGTSAASESPAISLAGIDAECSASVSAVAYDVVVDFSHPSMLGDVLSAALTRRVPAVLATTGYSDAQLGEIESASKTVPVFKTANMSVGINLMLELAQKAAAALADGFDIEIVEAHHNQKVDAPSGTALMLADAVNEAVSGSLEYMYDRHSVRGKRGKNELGIHSLRGGTVVGEHTVMFAGSDEVIEIKHSAASREVFAEGAVRAVRFIATAGLAPGMYDMRDALGFR